jgi:hypothetical protein
LINCLAWSVAGLFRYNDANVYVPNLLGLAFSLTQVFLKLLYSGDGGRPKDLSGDHDLLLQQLPE